MNLKKEPFLKMWRGLKTVELRLYDEKRRLVKVGDTVEFSCRAESTRTLIAEVTALHRFDSFKELYEALPLEKCGYSSDDIRTADSSDMLKYYSEEEQQRYGVVGIELKVVERRSTNYTRLSKYLSLILRHKPQAAGITLDSHGWADTAELIANVGKTHGLTAEILDEIVATDNKQRYSYNEDKTKIRANQGHSVRVDVELTEKEPPEYLWHGTGSRSCASIDVEGLLPKSRLYVHLSGDYDTAVNVGVRHGRPVVYRVKSGQMYRDGFTFFISANAVWLTKYVPSEYLEKQEENE